jgi:type VI secretion system protein ImpA
MTTNFIAHPDWAEWLGDISADLPCGPDLEYDPSFLLLEQAVTGRPEAEYGETVIAAVPPDWTTADALCLELLSRTRDLRLLGWLARGRLVRDGVAGLADGLAVIAGLLETHWDHVHPQLEAGDEADPTARINALAAFVDTTGILGDLLDMPIVPTLPSQTTALTLREWTYATGEVVAPAQRSVLSIAEIEAALAAAVGRAVSVRDALDAAMAHAARIEVVVTGRVGASQTIDLGPLTALLRRARSLIAEAMAKFEVVDENRAPDAKDGETLAAPSPADGARMAPQSIQIATRADVIATLDRVCDYYAHNEPSSPVPLLLKRARGLVDKSFIDLLGDLAPEGLAQLTQVVGTAGMSPSSD